MRSNVVLIDFENVQPSSLDLLAQEHFRVLVFVGASQTKVPFEIAASLQRLGTKAEYIKISANGSNALDFHIAYYIGVLSAEDPSAYFHIVSKDAGFDPLIQHLKTRKIFSGRVKDVGEIPLLKASSTKSIDERVRIVIERFSAPKATKPRTVKTLTSAVASIFQKQLSDEEVAEVIKSLESQQVVTVVGAKVTYASESAA